MLAWIAVEEGKLQQGTEMIRQGVANWKDVGVLLMLPICLALLAQGEVRRGKKTEGMTALDDAFRQANLGGDHLWLAELSRLNGTFQDEMSGAEIWFRKATDVARDQNAKSLELRACTDLARLWRDQGKRDEARSLLTPVYDWFTEGFDTPDLKAAKALLEQLS